MWASSSAVGDVKFGFVLMESRLLLHLRCKTACKPAAAIRWKVQIEALTGFTCQRHTTAYSVLTFDVVPVAFSIHVRIGHHV